MQNDIFGTRIRSVGIAAPASGCDPEKLNSGIRVLEQNGIRVIPGKNLFRRGIFSYLSADDSLRAEDFNRLAEDPEVDAIFCVRGGYGTPRILEQIRYDILRQRNLPVIGFSDITALHLAMCSCNAGICVASQMAARLPEAVNDTATLAGMKRVYARLSGESVPGMVSPLSCCNEQKTSVSGGIMPLNLTLASALCGTDFMPSMKGKIVVLEEIGEPVRKIDRMLWQLRASGFFKEVSAVIFAQFSDCGEVEERENLLADFAGKADYPVFSGFPYGHDLPSVSCIFNEPCKVENGMFSFV